MQGEGRRIRFVLWPVPACLLHLQTSGECQSCSAIYAEIQTVTQLQCIILRMRRRRAYSVSGVQQRKEIPGRRAAAKFDASRNANNGVPPRPSSETALGLWARLHFGQATTTSSAINLNSRSPCPTHTHQARPHSDIKKDRLIRPL